jgi:hypothetical protein
MTCFTNEHTIYPNSRFVKTHVLYICLFLQITFAYI